MSVRGQDKSLVLRMGRSSNHLSTFDYGSQRYDYGTADQWLI